MKLDYNELLIFECVARLGSFTLAADELGRPKGSVSRKIKLMEERLEVRLLDRTTRTLRLTEAGEKYFKYCHQVFLELNKAEEFIENQRDDILNTISIFICETITSPIIYNAIKNYKNLHPDTRINIRIGSTNRDEQSESDVILISQPTQLHSYETKKVVDEPQALYCATDYINQNSESSDILKHCFIFAANEIPFKLTHKNKIISTHNNNHIMCNNLMEKYRLCLQGLGIAQLPLHLVSEEVKKGHLLQPLDDYASPSYTIYSLTKKSAHKKVTDFIHHMGSLYEN